MSLLPKTLQQVIEDLGMLPGVGPRTAERYAYYLLKRDRIQAEKLSNSLSKLHSGVKYCPVTFALIDDSQDISLLYTDKDRDKTVIAVVAEPFDIISIEATKQFTGTYHVLGGLVSPIDGISPDQLHIKELVDRIDKDDVKEVILATNASVEGESTAIYLQQQLKGRDVVITRLARGLAVGVDIEYADQITLARALENRQTLL